VAFSGRTDLNQLFNAIKKHLASNGVVYSKNPVYRDFRAGDVRHSQADISKAGKLLGYVPKFDIDQGISKAMPWYVSYFSE
jgi:UDP-N-acetylglucosamine 4-epimerase